MDFLGSAAFSQAVQALDTATGALVCLKIIKNNKVCEFCWLLEDDPCCAASFITGCAGVAYQQRAQQLQGYLGWGWLQGRRFCSSCASSAVTPHVQGLAAALVPGPPLVGCRLGGSSCSRVCVLGNSDNVAQQLKELVQET